MMLDLSAFSSYQSVYFATVLLASIGALLSSAEYLVIRQEFKPEGVYSWKVMSSRPVYVLHSAFLRRIDFLFGYRGSIAVHALRVLCCLWLPAAIATHAPGGIPLLLILAISSIVLSFRNIIGTDGADQMSLLIFVALAISAPSSDSFVRNAGLVFIAGQSILSYVVSGVAKALSPKWRSGVALQQIVNTRTYGMEPVARWLTRAPRWLNQALCWAVIVIETGFFLVVFLPSPWLFFFLVWGMLFHVSNAVVMGLNNFFWSFTATYPSIIFLNHLIRR